MPLAEAHAARISFRNGSWGVPRTALARPLVFDSVQYPFEEILAGRSGIRWCIRNGKSPEKYLPKTTGAGCAFFDYDNDGWMDIYLVNSGKCDFFTPDEPLRNALYKDNRDGTFNVVTEKSGSGRRRIRPGRSAGRFMTDGDGFPDL